VNQVTTKLVRDLMHIGVATCRADTLLVEAVRTLLREDLESMREVRTLAVADVMNPEIPEVPPDIPATAAVQIMLDRGIREIYLMHHGGGASWPAAVLRYEDVLRYSQNAINCNHN
jgi:CBS domain-containing protein